MEKVPLFRPAAVAAQRGSAYGSVVLAQPLSLTALTLFAVAAAAGVAALLVWGSYTKHTTVRGSLVPDSGLIEVQAPQYGTVVARAAAEGALVEAGETLFAISSERVSSERGATLEAVRTQLLAKRNSITAEIARLREQESVERLSLRTRSRALEAERDSVRVSIDDQERRLAYAEQAAERYGEIEARGFVSRDQADARREAALEQRARLNALIRESARLDRELLDARRAVEAHAASFASRAAELERAAATAELEIAESEARRRVLVVAPQAGTVAALAAELGQTVAAGQVLALVVPAGALLQAHLYAPSAAIGFLDAGDEVLLRYEAYPHAKFGHQRGTVAAISRSVTPAPGGTPLYRIVVELERQSVLAYGEPRALRSGMAVQADIVQDTRRLYEWALEPLLVRGGAH